MTTELHCFLQFSSGLSFVVSYRILDESLKKSLHRYLEVRGIKHSLHDWLTDYMMGKDEKEYVVWLRNMREFIGK
jgi:complement component 1 Q subcomponent-binding protein